MAIIRSTIWRITSRIPQNVARDCDAENLAIVNNGHDDVDDSLQYVNGLNGRCSVVDDDSCSELYVGADLPKSFYQMEEEDECSDSDNNAGAAGTTGATGVSGAGQSNLSTEVAALIQSELMRPRLRISAGNSNADGRRRRRQPRRSGDAAPSNAAASAGAAAAVGDAVAAPGKD